MKNYYLLLFVIFAQNLIFSQDYRFGKVSEEEVLEKAYPLDSTANAAILFKSQKTYYELHQNTGFTLVTDVYERIKIYNKDGLDWATKEITAYQNGSDREKIVSVKGNTYNIIDGKLKDEKLRKDGIFDEEVNKYRIKTSLTMPAVTEGSVIEYSYTVRSPFLTSIDETRLQYTIPVERIEVQVKIPEFFGFKMHSNLKSPLIFDVDKSGDTFRYAFQESTRKSNGWTTSSEYSTNSVDYKLNVYQIQKDNVAALKKEPFVDYLENYAAYIKWELMFTQFPNTPVKNFTQTWEGVTKTIYDGNLGKELHQERYFRKDVDELLSGVSNPQTKVALIYDFVKKKVRWNDFVGYYTDNGLKSAYKDGVGNCADINLMLTAMLKYAGLTANPVLVSTPDNGIPVFPTINGFNYILASVELPNQTLLLDATDPLASVGELPKRARNFQGRLIREEGTSNWVDLIPTTLSEVKSYLYVSLDEELKITGKTSKAHQGLYAKRFRENNTMSDEKYLEKLEGKVGEFSISELVVENRQDINEIIKETYTFSGRNPVEEINGKIYLQPFLFEAIKENPFKADERNYPIFFDFPSIQNEAITFVVPEGYVLESFPESGIVELNGGEVKYTFLVQQSGSVLSIRSTLDLPKTYFTPEDYDGLKKFYSQIIEKQTEAIVLSKV
ncbi:transglutaminase domain-containing protein [Salegentibacter sp. F188]|uniref:Transglutaminase domain-containing protein n=1 Tax=Autumnicola patrickiae TaxID=3075591 RepID=A0ABU3DZE9_9FLAO|nr:transglutaminase domain-containing protein [Salegentibacter sp. F188]MDT0689109.1 transglutaminase domain-containing protein [Salegentibacter sp. F188]